MRPQRDLCPGDRFRRLRKRQCMRHAAHAAGPLDAVDRPLDRQSFQRFFNAPVRIEQRRVEPDHILTGLAEPKMTGFDDSGVNRPDRHFKHTFAVYRNRLLA